MTIFLPERNPLAVKFVRFAAKILFLPFFDIHVSGAHDIPGQGPFVLLPKHQRWEDIPIVAVSAGRPLYYAAKQELFSNLFSRNFISMLGGLPVNRRHPARSRDTYNKILRKLAENEAVVIFPEGTYFENRMGTGHVGLIRMIHQNVETIFIPAGIKYQKGRLRTDVRVSFGKAIQGSKFEDAQELLEIIMTEIAGLSGYR